MEGWDGGSHIKSQGRGFLAKRANSKDLSGASHGHGGKEAWEWGGEAEQARHDLQHQMVTGDIKGNTVRNDLCVLYKMGDLTLKRTRHVLPLLSLTVLHSYIKHRTLIHFTFLWKITIIKYYHQPH